MYRHQAKVYARLVVIHFKRVLTLLKGVLKQDGVG
jgi:hypothetical protein